MIPSIRSLCVMLLAGFLSLGVLACGGADADEDPGSQDGAAASEDAGPSLEEETKQFIGHWKMGAFENSEVTINSKMRMRMIFDTTDTKNPPLWATLVFSEEEDPMMKITRRKVLVQYDEGQKNTKTTRPYSYKLSEDGQTMNLGGPDHTRIDSEDDTSF